jgi:hypothetical protein
MDPKRLGALAWKRGNAFRCPHCQHPATVLASQQAMATLLASVEKAKEQTRTSKKAIRGSRELMFAPRPEPVLLSEQKMERWRIATQLAQKLKQAGFGCQLSVPVKTH